MSISRDEFVLEDWDIKYTSSPLPETTTKIIEIMDDIDHETERVCEAVGYLMTGEPADQN